MAEVTGDLGGQPIQLNNAATETTLKQLLAVMMAQTAKTGKQNLKDEKELRKELQALADAAKKATAEGKKSIEAAKDEKKAKEAAIEAENKLTKTSERVSSGFNALSKRLDGVIAGMANFTSSIANMGSSVASAANALNVIPIVGGTLATVLGAVATQAEKQAKAFQQASAVGATFSGGITEMVNSASRMGLTFDQFAGIINRSGKDIALLGSGSADGAKQLVKYSTAMRNSGLQDDLARLGFSAEEITGSIAKYGAQLKTLGYSQAQIDATLVQSTGDYLKNLDAVSKITGLNRQDLEKQRAERLKDSQFRAMMIGKDETTVKAMNSLLDTMDESQAKAFKEIAATGTAASDEAKALFTTAPQLAQAAMGAYNSMQTTGKYTMEQAATAHAAAQQEAKQRENMLKQLALYGDETQKRMALAAMNMGAQTLTLGESIKKTEDAAKAASENDPAKLMRLQQQTAEQSNRASLALANQFSKIVPIMQKFYEVLNDYVIPTLEWAADNIGLTIAALVGAKVGLLAMEAIGKRLLMGAAGKAIGAASMSSVLSQVATFAASAAGMSIMASAGLFGAVVLAAYAASRKPGEALSPEEQQLRDDRRAAGKAATMSEGQRHGAKTFMTEGTAREALASKLSDKDLTEFFGYNRKVLEEYVRRIDADKKQKGSGGSLDINEVAKDLGEVVTGFIDATNATAIQKPNDNIAEIEEPGGPVTEVEALAEATDELNEVTQTRIEIEKANQSLMARWDQARKKRQAEEAERAQEQLRLDNQILDQRKDDLATAKATGACKGYDFSSPEALFKSFREKNMQPGATAATQGAATGSTTTTGTTGGTTATGSSYSEIIGKYEGAGKYDTVFGQAGGAKINDKLITENTIAEVVAWQKANRHTNRHAAGKYGFIDVADVAKEAGIAADAMFNAETQEKMQQAFTARSARVLKGLGIEATNENLSLAHSVGPGGAQKLLNAQKSGQGNVTAADILGLTGAGRTTNPQLLKSVSEVIAANSNRFAGAPIPNGANPAGTVPVPNRTAVTPTATAVTSTIAPTTPVVTPGRTTPNQPGTGAPGAGGATPANEIAGALERLNSMTAQIVGYNKEVAETSRLQLSAIKSIGKVY